MAMEATHFREVEESVRPLMGGVRPYFGSDGRLMMMMGMGRVRIRMGTLLYFERKWYGP